MENGKEKKRSPLRVFERKRGANGNHTSDSKAEMEVHKKI